MSEDPRKPKGPAYHDTTEVPAFKGGTAENALMGEMMRGLEMFKRDVQGSIETSRRETQSDIRSLQLKFQNHADQTLKSHEETRYHVSRLTQMVKILWTSVKGSDPPPPPPMNGKDLSFSMSEPTIRAASPTTPLDEQVSNHDMSLASISGQLIALDSAQNQTRSEVEEVKQRTETIESQNSALLALQKEQMGKHEEGQAILKKLADTVVWCFTTKDGQKFLMLLVTSAIVFVREVRSVLHP